MYPARSDGVFLSRALYESIERQFLFESEQQTLPILAQICAEYEDISITAIPMLFTLASPNLGIKITIPALSAIVMQLGFLCDCKVRQATKFASLVPLDE